MAFQSWDAHLRRPRNAMSWPAKLLKVQDSLWLQARRIISNSVSIFAGATGTRANAGRVAKRWEDGVRDARAFFPWYDFSAQSPPAF